jgi:YVTN family beta-propeller protein
VRTLSVALLTVLTGLACQLRPVQTTSVVSHESRINVYLEALAQETNPLGFRIRSISLVRDDGRTLPLTLHIAEIDVGTLDRERLLASNDVSAGSYVGLELMIETASLGRGAEQASLTVETEPKMIQLPLIVGRRRGVTVSLRFHPSESVRDGYAFEPVFSGELPDQPPAGLVAVATSRATDSVILFDKISGRVVGTVPTGRQPSGMVLAPLRRRVYVAVTGDDSVEVIGIDEQDVIERLRLQGGDAPTELALTPDGKTLLSANSGSDSVSFIDPDGPFEIDRLSVGNGPNSVLIDSAGRRAYVFNSLGDSISILDLARRSVIGTIRTESEPLRGQFSPDEDRLYVIHRSSPNMLVIDPATMSIVNRVYVRSGASALKIDTRTGWIYLAHRSGGTIEVFEPDSFLPVGTIPVRGEVNYLTIDGETGNLFCVMRRSAVVRSISVASQRTITEVDLGGEPYWVTMMGER